MILNNAAYFWIKLECSKYLITIKSIQLLIMYILLVLLLPKHEYINTYSETGNTIHKQLIVKTTV